MIFFMWFLRKTQFSVKPIDVSNKQSFNLII